MKGKDIERLKEDFVKYCNQMGITDRPRLILNRKEMHSILVNAGQPKRCASWGECFWDLRTIFIDTGIRIHYPSRQYKGFRKPDRESVKHKSKYIDFRNTLVHELVHYRFPKMRHGWRYERRIIKILGGITFERMPMPMPISIPVEQPKPEPKKEYDGRLDYFL